jgi:hypothetical protein
MTIRAMTRTAVLPAALTFRVSLIGRATTDPASVQRQVSLSLLCNRLTAGGALMHCIARPAHQ